MPMGQRPPGTAGTAEPGWPAGAKGSSCSWPGPHLELAAVLRRVLERPEGPHQVRQLLGDLALAIVREEEGQQRRRRRRLRGAGG